MNIIQLSEAANDSPIGYEAGRIEVDSRLSREVASLATLQAWRRSAVAVWIWLALLVAGVALALAACYFANLT